MSGDPPPTVAANQLMKRQPSGEEEEESEEKKKTASHSKAVAGSRRSKKAAQLNLNSRNLTSWSIAPVAPPEEIKQKLLANNLRDGWGISAKSVLNILTSQKYDATYATARFVAAAKPALYI